MKNILSLVVLSTFFLTYNLCNSQVIGGRGNSEMSPKVAEPTKLSGGTFSGNVNTATGEFNAAIPLGSVATPAGLNFSLALNYTSSFSFGVVRPMTAGIPYGDGWSPNIPTISVETDVFHKYSCDKMYRDAESGKNGNKPACGEYLNFNNDNCDDGNNFNSTDEGDLYFFSPTVSIPGVASGTAVFKYVDMSDDNCIVFTLNKFERYVEIRFYGGEWVVILDDGTRYEFKTAMTDYRAPSNQRVLYYDQTNLTGSDQQQSSEDGYGGHANSVLNVVEPKNTYNVWYCDKITDGNAIFQGVVFEYETFGEFNYFKEFKQTNYQQARQYVFGAAANTDFKVYTDVFLKSIHSYVMDSKVDIIELDYRSLNNVIDNGILLDHRREEVNRLDSLYSYKTIEKWDLSGNPNTTNFSSWKRFKHQGDINNGDQGVNSSNPYVKTQGIPSYSNESVVGNEPVPFDHGFLESPRGVDNGYLYPGDRYEVKSKIIRNDSQDLDNGNGTLDIAIRTGPTDQASLDNIQESGFNTNRGKEIFSTFNSAVKWQMGFGQGQLETSNIFVMPNVPSDYGGFNIQIGPGNSDIDFGAVVGAGVNSQLGSVGQTEVNALGAYPYMQNWGRLIGSTSTIPHNFGTGHPWSMMLPLYNEIATEGDNWVSGTAGDYTELYKTWWNNNPAMNPYENIPTKFDENVKLHSVEIIRYSKNAYMLQGVRVYKVNGEYSDSPLSSSTGKILVSQKKLEYGHEDEPVLKNIHSVSGSPLQLEGTRRRRVILLQRVREIPVDGDLYAQFYGFTAADTSKILTTFLGYTKYLDNVEDLAQNATYSNEKPYIGVNQYVLDSYIDHLGGITKVSYYPLDVFGDSPSRVISSYAPSSCADFLYTSDPIENEPFGTNRSYSAHVAVQYMGKNDEQDILRTSNVLWGNGLKVWEYEYNMDFFIQNPKQVSLPIKHFRNSSFNRSESGFSKVRVYSPEVNGLKNYTDYEYYGSTDDDVSLEEFLYYGKLKSVRNYDGNGVIHDEKLINYSHTLAFLNGRNRPSPLREYLPYPHIYEYRDIYLNETTSQVGGLSHISGNYDDLESPKLLDYYFYDDLADPELNPIYLSQSYFVKKTSEIDRVYEDRLSKNNGTINPFPGPVLPNSRNGLAIGLVNPVSPNAVNDQNLINLIASNSENRFETLVNENGLSDSVLLNVLTSNLTTDQLKNLIILQGAVSDFILKALIDQNARFSENQMNQIIDNQPYFTNSVQAYMVQNTNLTSNYRVLEAILLKNEYLSDSVLTILINRNNIPGEVLLNVLEKQPQQTEEMLLFIVNSNKVNQSNLYKILKNQGLPTSVFLRLLNKKTFLPEQITKLIESTPFYPVDEVLEAILRYNFPRFTSNQIKRIFAVANREISSEINGLLRLLYPLIPFFPGPVVFVPDNELFLYCNNATIEGRTYIETKTEYEYYEADYTGKAIGKPYEVLLGQIENIDEPSTFPKTIEDFWNSSPADELVLTGLHLRHEPSWQVFSVKSSSPHMPNAFSREEYFYLYDLKNRYNRHWFNYDFANLYVDIVNYGTPLQDTVLWHEKWADFNDGPKTPNFDGMERTQEVGNRQIAFQKTTVSKNTRDQEALYRSEYYQYDRRWKYDDLPGATISIPYEGEECELPDEQYENPCDYIRSLAGCYSFFYKPYVVLEEVVPPNYCAWAVSNCDAFICPAGIDLAQIVEDFGHPDYGAAWLLYCGQNFEDVESPGNAFLNIGQVMSKTLLLRDVTVQVDTLKLGGSSSFGGLNEFDYYKLDPKNSYIVDFYLGSQQSIDANGFKAPYHMIYPYDNLTVRTILERNRYFQPKLEENQVELQTKYYYNTAKSYQYTNTNSTCANGIGNYGSVENYNIGLPNRITVGYNRPDSLSTTYQYNGIGQVRKVVDPSLKTMGYDFDTYHRLIEVRENGLLLSEVEYNNWEHEFSLDFDSRTNENYVTSKLYNSPSDFETRKAFMDPLGRNHSVVSKYDLDASNYAEIHSGTVEYDLLDRVTKSFKNYTENVTTALIDKSNNTSVPFAESFYSNDPKSRVYRASNYDVDINDLHVVKSIYHITNNVFTSCELNLSGDELDLIMRDGNTNAFRFRRTEILDQDDKRSIEYINALGQKVASLKYNENEEKIVTLFVYDSYGNLSQVINPTKQNNTFEYNILGQLVSESSVDAGEKKYMYNKQGLVSMTMDQQGLNYLDEDNDSEYAPFYRIYQYDDYGRLLKVGRRNGVTATNTNEVSFSGIYEGVLYGPLHYSDTIVENEDPQAGSSDYFYFNYQYSNASTQDWLTSYQFYNLSGGYIGLGINTSNDVYPLPNDIDHNEKEYVFSGEFLARSDSYNNKNLRVYSTSHGYDNRSNIAFQRVKFSSSEDVLDPSSSPLTSNIYYSSYNLRNSLQEQKIDVNGDNIIDFHCYMVYDKLNRLTAIHGAVGQVSSISEASLLVTYEHDDANGLVLKKKHYLTENGLTHIANAIDYNYDSRDRLTNIQVGQTGFDKIMDYSLFYDEQTPFYNDNGNLEVLPSADKNWNGNINGSNMKYRFNSTTIVEGPSLGTFEYPTLYGFNYDKINRLVEANATIGDFLQDPTGDMIGDVTFNYDRIGNISSLHRTSRNEDQSAGALYTSLQHFNYVYGNGNNRLLFVLGLSGTGTRNYSYDDNGNLLTDDSKTLTGTEYGRASYPFTLHIDDGTVDYLYSADDQRIYKKTGEPTGAVENYYLVDAMGKTVAINQKTNSISGWEYYVSGAEREAKILPTLSQSPGNNQAHVTADEARFGKEMVNYYLYDHLGNTRITYTPFATVTQDEIILENHFDNGSLQGWVTSYGSLNLANEKLQTTTNSTFSQYASTSKTVQYPFEQGKTYSVSINVDPGNTTYGLELGSSAFSGRIPLNAGVNTFEFVRTSPGSIVVFAVYIKDYALIEQTEYTFTIDDFILSSVEYEVKNKVDYVADYFPYGKVVREYVGGDKERYLTTQHERDEETGLDYRGARYYDSDVARFLSLDPHATKYTEWSPYAYGFCNPVSFIDPDGKDPEKPMHYSFLNGAGLEIYKAARANGASPKGAMVILAQASTESSWGSSQVAKEHSNFFGMMGGGSGISTSHGELASYKSARQGIDAYFGKLNQLWPGALETMKQNNITADDWNKSLNTGKYQKYPAYFVPGGGHSEDYGDYIVNKMLPGVEKRFIQMLDYDIAGIQNQAQAIINSSQTMINILKSKNSVTNNASAMTYFNNQNAINYYERKIGQAEKDADKQTQELIKIRNEISN